MLSLLEATSSGSADGYFGIVSLGLEVGPEAGPQRKLAGSVQALNWDSEEGSKAPLRVYAQNLSLTRTWENKGFLLLLWSVSGGSAFGFWGFLDSSVGR